MKSALRSLSTSVLIAIYHSALEVLRFYFMGWKLGSMFKQWTITLGSMPGMSWCNQAKMLQWSRGKLMRSMRSCLVKDDPILQVLERSSSNNKTSTNSFSSSLCCSFTGPLGSSSSNFQTLLSLTSIFLIIIVPRGRVVTTLSRALILFTWWTFKGLFAVDATSHTMLKA